LLSIHPFIKPSFISSKVATQSNQA